jgi:probable HAF family extracellular repeat protein
MKAKIFTYVTAMILFGALLASFPPTAQEQVNNLASAPRKYTLEVLPGLGGLAGAFSINDTGLVSGTSEPSGDPFDRALVWRDAQPADLGSLGGHNSSVAYPNKNDNGWLAGFSETSDSDPYQENFCQFMCSSPTGNCLPFNQTCRGFLWQSKTSELIALPSLPGGNNSYAFTVNNLLQAVGAAENGVLDPTCIAPQVFDFEAVVWSLGPDGAPFISQRLSPIVGDTVSAADAIDQHGNAVGASGPCGPLGPGIGAHAVLWQGGRPIDLGNLGGAMNNIATAINHQGQIVGISDLPGDNATHSFLWQGGTMKDLGTLRPDDTFVLAESINDRGEVVGFSCGPVDCRGFHWQGGVMTDLNSFLPASSPLLITNAADINSRGEIAVQAFDQTLQDFVAAVLIPDGNEDPSLGAAAQTENIQHKVVVLPEHIREMLESRLPRQNFLIAH